MKRDLAGVSPPGLYVAQVEVYIYIEYHEEILERGNFPGLVRPEGMSCYRETQVHQLVPQRRMAVQMVARGLTRGLPSGQPAFSCASVQHREGLAC